jgi:hypothetical protein
MTERKEKERKPDKKSKDDNSKNYAKLEIEIALAPLFYTVKDQKTRPNAIIRREHANGWVEIRCFERLSIFDESVVLALMQIANDRKRTKFLTSSPKSELGKELRNIMDPGNDLKDQKVGMLVDTDLNEIAKIMGYKKPSKKDRDNVMDSIVRIGSVTIRERNNAENVEYGGLPGFIRYKLKDDGRLAFVIMRRLAMAAFGEEGWRFALVSMDERNELKGDISKTLHKWLVAWIFTSEKIKKGPRYIGLDKLATHVWHDWDSYTPGGQRCCRKKLKEALHQINSLPFWSATVEGEGAMALVCIERLGPKTARLEEASKTSDLDGELPPYLTD